ncbi:Ribose operon repressor [Serratia rubidaea]|uniref:Ribose operon repressor n=1 Tax=Serratia rubidaea TaxID=61652 RepID=A0A4U9HNL9_SERRU|nr:Ribose operon repressor [Serratia rubidaea]
MLAGGDYMAVGAVNALQRLGFSVPNDMSVMSMDGFNLAEIHDVPLTSLHVPRDELGFEAIQLLQRRMLRPTPRSVTSCCRGGWRSANRSSASTRSRRRRR